MNMMKNSRYKTAVLGAAVAAFLPGSYLCAEAAPKVETDISVRINGQEIDPGQIGAAIGSIVESLPERTADQLQRVLNDAGIDGAKTGAIIGQVLNVLPSLTPEQLDVLLQHSGLGGGQIGDIVGDVLAALPAGSAEELQKLMKTAGGLSLGIDSKAYVVGPDGEMKEIDLIKGGFSAEGGFSLDWGAPAEHEFFIGVEVESVPEVLRDHLTLPEDGGMLVAKVFPGTAAEKAGVEPHDILLKADEKVLGERADLVEAVQAAGEGGRPLSLEILRKGEILSKIVTPAHRELPMVASSLFVPGAGDPAAAEIASLREEMRKNRELLEQVLAKLDKLEASAAK